MCVLWYQRAELLCHDTSETTTTAAVVVDHETKSCVVSRPPYILCTGYTESIVWKIVPLTPVASKEVTDLCPSSYKTCERPSVERVEPYRRFRSQTRLKKEI